MFSLLPFSLNLKQYRLFRPDAGTKPSSDVRDTWRLRDGTSITLRPSRPEDGPLIQSFIGGLSAQSSYHRFFYPAHELPPKMLDRFTHNAPKVALTLLAVIQREGREVAIAMAQTVGDPWPERCDFAVVVADEWQRHGLGRRLVETLICIARNAGFEQIEGDVLAENRAMLRLLMSMQFRLMRHDEGTYLVKAVKELEAAEWKCSPLAVLGNEHGAVNAHV